MKSMNDVLTDLKNSISEKQLEEVVEKTKYTNLVARTYEKLLRKLTMEFLASFGATKDTVDFNFPSFIYASVVFLFTQGYIKGIEDGKKEGVKNEKSSGTSKRS